ncbi:hypothetical protein PLESTF_001725100 [Pleodorina starrii]|nr:hypothetical protein PLESTF_001725100 [Pleodorina starrii]
MEPEKSSVIIWDLEQGEVLHTPTDHSGWLDVAAISGPAGLAAVTGVHGILFVWDIQSGVQRYQTKFDHGMRSSCRFSPCGNFILVGGYDLGELVLLESRYGQELLRVHTSQEPGTFNTATDIFFLGEPSQTPPPKSPMHHCSEVDAASVCGRGPHAGFSKRYYKYGPATLKQHGKHKKVGNSSSWSSSRSGGSSTMSSGEKVFLGGNSGSAPPAADFSFPTRFGAVCSDGSIRVFDTDGDSFNDALWRDQRMQVVYDVDVSRDATLLFAVYAAESPFQEALHVYDFQTGELVWNYPSAHKGTYGGYLVASGDAGLLAPDGDGGGGENRRMRGQLVTAGGDGKTLDIKGQKYHTADSVCPQVNERFDQMLTTADGYDAWTCLWDLSTGQLLHKYDKVHKEGIYDAWFTRDGKRCVSVSCDKTAAIFDLASGRVIQRFEGHENWVRFAALSPDETILATASNDNTVRIWSVSEGNVLHVIRDHRGTPTCINFMHPTWVVSCARDGTIIGFNLKTKTSTPLLVAGPGTGEVNGWEKIRPMPLSTGVAGSRFPPVLAVSDDNRAVVLNLSVRQPKPTKNNAAIASAPLPANGDGKTPLDLALDAKSLQCVELLLDNELKRPAPLRLATMKAWSRLAADMPTILVKFLEKAGIPDCKDRVGNGSVDVLMRAADPPLITCGTQMYELDRKRWGKIIGEREEGTETEGDRRQLAWRWAKHLLRPFWPFEEPSSFLHAVVPGVCGLPYVALATRAMSDSPLGALVANNVNEAFTTDIGLAMLTYKWDTYAGGRYRTQAFTFGIFMLLYVLTTTLGVQWNVHVDHAAMYGGHGARAVIRIVLESIVLLVDLVYLIDEVCQLLRHGPLEYFTGGC